MSYNRFTLPRIQKEFGVTLRDGVLFPVLPDVAAPAWLLDQLARGRRQHWLTEKARSEFVVAPMLLAVQELGETLVAIFSGEPLDVDPERGLNGECDFILAATERSPVLRSPVVTVVEAKRDYIEGGLAQCIAQMLGAQLFNQRAGDGPDPVFGCVTTGEIWEFLRLEGASVTLDPTRRYLDHPEAILQVLVAMVRAPRGGAPPPSGAGTTE